MKPATIILLTLWSAVGIACGGVRAARGSSREAVELHRVGGARVLALPRNTPNVVHLSLWVDAGSRDADPPQVATVAAWLAERRAGREVQARVHPDGTSFERLCAPADLAECVGSLMRALDARDVEEVDADRMRSRLADARRRAAVDEERLADALALQAALGPQASALLPLGSHQTDTEVTQPRIAAFLADHYGPTRALLVAAGDIEDDPLRDAVEDALGETREANLTRASRGIEPAAEQPRIEVGESAHVSAAAITGDFERATAVARGLAGTGVLAGHLRIHAFPLRGGAIVLASTDGPDPATAAGRLAFELERLMVEGAPTAPRLLPADPIEAARDVGLSWIAETGDATQHERIVIGIGAVLRGGRGDTRRGDPDAQRRRQGEEAVREAVQQAHADLHPELRGDLGEAGGSVVAPNGARITVDPGGRTGGRMAVAVRFGGGASEDPPRLHGRAGLAAYAATNACAGLRHGALSARLQALGASMSPLVDAHSWGLVVSAPTEYFREAIDVALRCAVSPSLLDADVERARLGQLEELGEGEQMAAWASSALSPDAPGIIAPWGVSERVRDVGAADLRRFVRQTAVGARLSVALIGDVPQASAARRIARRVSRLPRGRLPAQADPGTPEQDVLAVRWEGERPRVVVTFRAERPRHPSLRIAAEAFAHAVAAELRREGVRPLWAAGSAGQDGAWCAIALEAPDDTLDDLPDRVRRAVSRASRGRQVARIVQRFRRRQALSAAHVGAAAAELAAKRLEQLGGPRGRRARAQLIAELSRGTPHYVIGRPTPR